MKTFEIDFPSLKGFIFINGFSNSISKSDILKFCLDKQKVREVIEKVIKETGNKYGAFSVYQEIEKELLKELGL